MAGDSQHEAEDGPTPFYGRPLDSMSYPNDGLPPPTGADAWRDDALCAQTDPGLFFPEKGESTGPAKDVCSRCPVRDPCLEHAVLNDERFGIWGGLSEGQRRRLG